MIIIAVRRIVEHAEIGEDYTGRSNPTEFLPILSHICAGLAQWLSAPARFAFLKVCPVVQKRPAPVSSRRHQ